MICDTISGVSTYLYYLDLGRYLSFDKKYKGILVYCIFSTAMGANYSFEFNSIET